MAKDKRTNITTTDRTPSEIVVFGSKGYECFKTEYDIALRYKTMDTWAKFPDFRDRYGNWVREAMALSKVNIGWCGTHAATPWQIKSPASWGL
jgi:hypothetical protein